MEEIYTSRMKKDIKLVKKQGKDRDKLYAVVEKLKNGTLLEAKYKDYNLSGNYIGCRECHIEPDWLLVYRIDKTESKLYLLRTGSHSNLFKESFRIDINICNLNKKLTEILNKC